MSNLWSLKHHSDAKPTRPVARSDSNLVPRPKRPGQRPPCRQPTRNLSEEGGVHRAEQVLGGDLDDSPHLFPHEQSTGYSGPSYEQRQRNLDDNWRGVCVHKFISVLVRSCLLASSEQR